MKVSRGKYSVSAHAGTLSLAKKKKQTQSLAELVVLSNLWKDIEVLNLFFFPQEI